MEPQKHSIGSIIAGILFLIIFIGGMIGMYVGSKTDLRICLMSLGAILLSVGIVSAVNGIKIKGAKKITPLTIAAIFILIGAGLIIYPLLNIFTGFVIGNEIIVYSALGMFVLIGLLLIIIPIAKNLYLKKVCTVVVEAKCTELASSGFYDYDGRCSPYIPVWEYTFDGVTYHEKEPTARNFALPSEGDYCELHVNPDNPKEFYQETSPVKVFYLVLGLFFAAMGILAIILTSSQGE